ncbi:hypothetical protein MNBD_GAMMA21-2976 [hydrothermal vent metagenome]|uniref:Uncharacterized protein n=1 Tax=hydrothermal vent metagenome TaxID=652676 RepID=A0A3B1A382_9ZZZZ
MKQRTLLTLLFSLLSFSCLSTPGYAEEKKETLQATEIYDLRYGETLFNYFQQKYFSAITNLMVANVRDPIQVQGEDPNLLLGGLYLAYGMHNDASVLFQELLSSESLPATHDKAWYYIAKLRYLKGYTAQAEQALIKIKDTLPEEREAERLHLLANIYINQKKYPQAIELLKDFDGSSEWEAYAQFNLGVALVKAGQLEDGTELLNEVSSLDPFSINHELNALRDKAALALGFTYMRANRPTDAETQFKRIRLNGPLSNKALLGLGWSFTSQEKYTAALSPWLELQNRKALATTVQESMIAIPFTIEKLGKKRLAMKHYQYAINAYGDEINRLEDVMVAVQRGELIEAMRPANIDDESSLPLNSFGLPKSVSAPYLNQMMATNTFQEAYKNYQSLIHLKYILKRWWSQLPAYELMLNERRNAYYKKLPEVASDARLKGISTMQDTRNKFATEIKRIKKESDGFALVTEEEEELVLILKNVETNLALLSKTQDMSYEYEKFKLLKGVLDFKLQSEFIPRLWSVQNNLKELDRALDQTRKSKRSLVKTANNAPKFFEGYDKKIAWSKTRITNLVSRLDTSIKRQEQYIEKIAREGLIKRRQQLENYHVRARFGIARLYDSLIIDKDKKATEAALKQKEAEQADDELADESPSAPNESSSAPEAPAPTDENLTKEDQNAQ